MIELFKTYGALGVEKIKQSLEAVRATGKTINSVRFEVSQNVNTFRLRILARPYTSAIETGVRPTTKGVSREMIESLTEYAQARGMDKPKNAAWALAKSIQKKGDRTFRSGGRTVYSDDAILIANELKKQALKEFKIKSTNFIKNTFDGAIS